MAKKKNKTKHTSSAPVMTQAEKQAAEAAKKKKKRTGIIAACIAGVAAVIVFVLIGSADTGIFAAHTNAATVGGVRVPTTVYDYYYEQTYYALISGYGENAESVLGSDWRDLVISYADENCRQDVAFYTEAVNAGMELSEAGRQSVEAAVEEMRSKAVENGIEDVDRYLAGSVGAGCNLENYRQYEEMRTLADEYSRAHRDSLTFTQDEIDARYNEDPGRYEMYTFYSYDLEGATQEEAEGVVAQIHDMDSFNSAIRDYQGEDAPEVPSDTCLRHNPRVGYVNTGVLEWIEAAPRSEGDVAAVDYNGRGYFIVYYVSKNEDRSVIDSEVTEDLRADAMSAWTNEILDRYPIEHNWLGMQGVGAYDR